MAPRQRLPRGSSFVHPITEHREMRPDGYANKGLAQENGVRSQPLSQWPKVSTTLLAMALGMVSTVAKATS
jgi:hypothetical protein